TAGAGGDAAPGAAPGAWSDGFAPGPGGDAAGCSGSPKGRFGWVGIAAIIAEGASPARRRRRCRRGTCGGGRLGVAQVVGEVPAPVDPLERDGRVDRLAGEAVAHAHGRAVAGLLLKR